MTAIAGLVAPFFGLIFIGYFTARLRQQPAEAHYPADTLGWLNTFIIYVALPALFFKLISKTPVEQLTRFDFIFFNLAATYAVFTLVFMIGRFWRQSSTAEATIQGLSGAYGNIGYMGPGLALLAFGERAAVPLALIFCFENMLHFIVAPALMAIGGDNKRGARQLAADIARKIAFHPFIVSTAVGIIAAILEFQPPLPMQRLIDYLAQAAAPCALFAMGVALATRPLRRIPAEIIYIVPVKLILLPVVMYVMLSMLGNFDPVWVHTAVLLSSLPTAANVFVIGQQYGVWQERASATILITTVLSVVSVSGLLYLIHSGLLIDFWR